MGVINRAIERWTKCLNTPFVNVDLMLLYLHQMYRPIHYSPLAQAHRIGLKGSRPCLMVYAHGMRGAQSGEGIRHKYTQVNLNW